MAAVLGVQPAAAALHQLRQLEVVGDAIADGRVPADRIVDLAPDEDVLPVGDRHLRARVVHQPQREEAEHRREDLRQQRALPEGLGADVGHQREEVGAVLARRGHRRGQRQRLVLGVRVGEEQPRRAARLRDALRVRVVLAQPAGREVLAAHHRQPRIGERRRLGESRVLAAVVDADDPQPRPLLREQRSEAAPDLVRLVAGRNDRGHLRRVRRRPRELRQPHLPHVEQRAGERGAPEEERRQEQDVNGCSSRPSRRSSSRRRRRRAGGPRPPRRSCRSATASCPARGRRRRGTPTP